MQREHSLSYHCSLRAKTKQHWVSSASTRFQSDYLQPYHNEVLIDGSVCVPLLHFNLAYVAHKKNISLHHSVNNGSHQSQVGQIIVFPVPLLSGKFQRDPELILVPIFAAIIDVTVTNMINNKLLPEVKAFCQGTSIPSFFARSEMSAGSFMSGISMLYG